MADTGTLTTTVGRSRRWMQCIWALCLLWGGTAPALSREGTIEDPRQTTWGSKEGTPSAIQAIAQTSDGYLWLGNSGGLFLFDGLRFERIALPRDDRLGPGMHRFHVTAANNDGVWNDTGATIDFVVPPTFVQTGGFIALCAASAVLFVWLAIRFRVRRVAARMRIRFAERMAERERIARELHDTLLQSTQGLILRFQAVANRIALDDPTREMLDEALKRADAVMAEGRDRVLDLRVSADPQGSLPEAFAATGDELAQGRPVTFRTVVEGAPRHLHPVAKDEAYRIGREALVNAFRHAQAASVEIQIIYADEGLHLRIRDDGIGADARTLDVGYRPDHWGLQGMRERAHRMGATFELWSRPGAGTEIELRIPAARAYPGRTWRSRWWTLRLLPGDRR